MKSLNLDDKLVAKFHEKIYTNYLETSAPKIFYATEFPQMEKIHIFIPKCIMPVLI